MVIQIPANAFSVAGVISECGSRGTPSPDFYFVPTNPKVKHGCNRDGLGIVLGFISPLISNCRKLFKYFFAFGNCGDGLLFFWYFYNLTFLNFLEPVF